METAPLFLTQSEVDYWINKLRDFLYETEIANIHLKLEIAKRRNFTSLYTPDSLFQEILRVTKTTKAELVGKSRKRKYVEIRMATCGLLYRLFSSTISLNCIGRYVGKDHTMVIYYLKQISECHEMKIYYNNLCLKLGIEP